MTEIEVAPSLNVLGEPLAPCSMDPVTGFFRNGCCDTCDQDVGSHTVCAVMTEEFLAFSKSVGNDLSTPHPQFGFSGLKAGDNWCLCAARFLQAWEAGMAPLDSDTEEQVWEPGWHPNIRQMTPPDRTRWHPLNQPGPCPSARYLCRHRSSNNTTRIRSPRRGYP